MLKSAMLSQKVFTSFSRPIYFSGIPRVHNAMFHGSGTKLSDNMIIDDTPKSTKEFDEMLTKDSESKKILNIVDFYAHWCGPCRMISPLLENTVKKLNKEASATNDATRVRLLKVDVDDASCGGELAARNNISALPTIVAFDSKSRKELGRFTGLLDAKAIEAFVKNLAK